MELSHTRMNDIVGLELVDGLYVWRPRCTWHYQQLYVKLGYESESEFSVPGVIQHMNAAMYGSHLANAHRFKEPDWCMRNLAALLANKYKWIRGAMKDDILNVGEIYSQHMELDAHAVKHFFEVRVAFDREWLKVDPNKQVDRVAGTGDHLWLVPRGGRFRLKGRDYKFGYRDLSDPTEAQSDPQAQLYAWLYYLYMRELGYDVEQIDFELWNPRFGPRNRSFATFYPEAVEQLVKERVDAAWAQLELEWREHGTEPWTARPHWSTCRYCRLTKHCPEYQKYRKRRVQLAA